MVPIVHQQDMNACYDSLQLPHCRSRLELCAWGMQLEAEHAIPAEQRFYCPNVECSTLMIVEKAEAGQETPCVACKEALCFYCRTKAHAGLSCSEAKVSLL